MIAVNAVCIPALIPAGRKNTTSKSATHSASPMNIRVPAAFAHFGNVGHSCLRG